MFIPNFKVVVWAMVARLVNPSQEKTVEILNKSSSSDKTHGTHTIHGTVIYTDMNGSFLLVNVSKYTRPMNPKWVLWGIEKLIPKKRTSNVSTPSCYTGQL